MSKKLICADDYAITSNVSKGILKLLKSQKINSTSCIVTTKNASHDMNLLKKFNSDKRFIIGLHLVLTSFKPSTKFLRIKKFSTITSLYLNLIFKNITKEEIKNELRNQILIFKKKFGNFPKLIDSHHHVHQLPVISDIVISVLNELKLTKKTIIRNTSVNIKDAFMIKNNFFKIMLLSIIGIYFKKKIKKNRIKTNKYFLGVYDFKNINTFKKWHKIFRKINSFCILMCHPGYSDKILRSLDNVTKQRDVELNFLLNN